MIASCAGRRRSTTEGYAIDCTADTIAIGEFFLVHAEAWAQAASPEPGMLCIGCLEQRLA